MSLKYTVEEAVTAWRRTARIASITSGRLHFQKDSVVVTAVTRYIFKIFFFNTITLIKIRFFLSMIRFSQRDLAKEESVKFQTNYTLSKADFSLISNSQSVDASNV
jgi:hypothetical protein